MRTAQSPRRGGGGYACARFRSVCAGDSLHIDEGSITEMAVRFEASRGLLGPLLSLLLVYCCTIELVSSQNYCDRLPNNAELERLIADTLRTSDASTPPDITVLEVNYVCLASGRLRDTFTTFSAVVRYNCVGVRCPQSNVSQFEFGCLRGTWSNRVLGRTENLRTNVADASLNSPNRTDCSFCFSPSHSALSDNPQLEPIYDSFNHCLGIIHTPKTPYIF